MKLEEWVERHRREGHHPHAAPTKENPERWDCECGGLWRILTIEQLRRKFAHLKHTPPLANPTAERAAPADRRPVWVWA
jgi:hypothetical protein